MTPQPLHLVVPATQEMFGHCHRHPTLPCRTSSNHSFISLINREPPQVVAHVIFQHGFIFENRFNGPHATRAPQILSASIHRQLMISAPLRSHDALVASIYGGVESIVAIANNTVAPPLCHLPLAHPNVCPMLNPIKPISRRPDTLVVALEAGIVTKTDVLRKRCLAPRPQRAQGSASAPMRG